MIHAILEIIKEEESRMSLLQSVQSLQNVRWASRESLVSEPLQTDSGLRVRTLPIMKVTLQNPSQR